MKAVHCIFWLPPTIIIPGGHIICEIYVLVGLLFTHQKPYYCKPWAVKLIFNILECSPTHFVPNIYLQYFLQHGRQIVSVMAISVISVTLSDTIEEEESAFLVVLLHSKALVVTSAMVSLEWGNFKNTRKNGSTSKSLFLGEYMTIKNILFTKLKLKSYTFNLSYLLRLNMNRSFIHR